MMAKKKIGIWKIFSIVLISIVVSLGAMELILRGAGWAILYRQYRANPEVNLDDPLAFRILAVGQSTTGQYWSAGRDESWAGQLQNRLNEAGLGRHFRVTNLGLGGTSTSSIAYELRANILKFQPHAVISLTGNIDKKGFVKTMSFFDSFRVVRILRLIHSHTFTKNFVLSKTIRPKEASNIKQHLEDELRGLSEAPVSQIEFLREKVEAYNSKQGKNERYANYTALRIFHRVAEDLTAQKSQGKTVSYERAKSLADGAFHFGVAAGKQNPTDTNHLRMALKATWLESTNDEQLEILRRLIIKYSLRSGMTLNGPHLTPLQDLRDPEIRLLMSKNSGFRVLQEKSSYEVTLESYRKIADICRENGISYLAMQYPMGNVAALKNIFSEHPITEFDSFSQSMDYVFPEQKIANKYQEVKFISNENFNNVVNQKNYHEYFTDESGLKFGHATTKGHALIAENATNAIIANWSKISKNSRVAEQN